MRRGRTLIFLILIVVVLGVGALALPSLLGGLTATPTPVSVQVYYAVQAFLPGDPITEDKLSTYSLAQDQVAGVMFTAEEKDQLIGQIAKVAIDQGTLITSGLVAPPGAVTDIGGPQWASIIPAGKTAVAIPISRLAAVAYGVADGAHVNLMACFAMIDVDPSFQTQLPNGTATVLGPNGAKIDEMPGISLSVAPAGEGTSTQGRTEVEPAFQLGIYVVPSEAQRPRVVCQMMLQDVTVLRLGNFSLEPSSAAANAATPTPLPNQQSVQTVTLAPDIITLIVSPQEAVALAYMVVTNTPMYLTLRNPTDPARQVTEAATLQFLLSQFNIPVPVKLAYALTPRTDVLFLPFLPNDVVTVPAQ